MECYNKLALLPYFVHNLNFIRDYDFQSMSASIFLSAGSSANDRQFNAKVLQIERGRTKRYPLIMKEWQKQE